MANRTALLLTLLTTGCLGGYDPHSLILVEVDDAVGDAYVNGVNGVVRGREIVRAACHEWDTVGARFRMRDEIPAGEQPTGTLHVRRALVPLGAGVGGAYTWGDGVRINLDTWPTYWSEKTAVHIVAHEMGHAFGLPHVDDCKALMAGADHGCNLVPPTGITHTDVMLFDSMWEPAHLK